MMAEGLALESASSCATVNSWPPMVTLTMPSPAVTVIVPVVVSVVPPVGVKPLSYTVAWPVAAPPFPSTGRICGAPSVWPLIVMVSVLLAESNPGSVMV